MAASLLSSGHAHAQGLGWEVSTGACTYLAAGRAGERTAAPDSTNEPPALAARTQKESSEHMAVRLAACRGHTAESKIVTVGQSEGTGLKERHPEGGPYFGQ